MRIGRVAAIVWALFVSAATAVDYMPLREGNQWTYTMSNGMQIVTKITGFESVRGVRCAVVESTVSGQTSREYMAVDAQGVKSYMSQMQGQQFPHDPPVLQVRLPYRQGDTWQATINQTGMSMNTTFESAGREQIQTRAGSFDCVKVVSSMETGGQSMGATIWYADGIGPVHQIMKMGGQEIEITLVSTNVKPAMPTNCLKCGVKLSPGAKLCPACGEKIVAVGADEGLIQELTAAVAKAALHDDEWKGFNVDPANLNKRAKDGSTALHQAVRSGYTNLAELLIKNGADIDACVRSQGSVVTIDGGTARYYEPGRTALLGTPLHWAAHHNQPEIVRILLNHGAKVNADNGSGVHAIHYAARSGNMEIIHGLVAAGADWSRAPVTPLHFAKTGDVAEFFIKRGIDVNAYSPIGQPIHGAALWGHAEVLERLLRDGADVNAKTSFQLAYDKVMVTPLWVAAWSGSVEMLDALVRNGGDLQYQDAVAGSLLHAAAMNGHAKAIDYLVKKNVKLDSKADFPYGQLFFSPWQGITPLGLAANHGHLAAVRALVEAGADVNTTFTQKGFKERWNCLAIAEANQQQAIVSYLRSKGARPVE